MRLVWSHKDHREWISTHSRLFDSPKAAGGVRGQARDRLLLSWFTCVWSLRCAQDISSGDGEERWVLVEGRSGIKAEKNSCLGKLTYWCSERWRWEGQAETSQGLRRRTEWNVVTTMKWASRGHEGGRRRQVSMEMCSCWWPVCWEQMLSYM